MPIYLFIYFFFFFNDTATTEIYTLSLHDALPIRSRSSASPRWHGTCAPVSWPSWSRSEEHTSELQSRFDLVCRLLLEKKQHTRVPTIAEKRMKKLNFVQWKGQLA